MTSFRFLPWQEKRASSFLKNQEQLGHSWLIYGSPGIGKLNFVIGLSVCLLCEQPEKHLACRKCIACHWALNINHPDLKILKPDFLQIKNGKYKDGWYESTHISSYTKQKVSREISINQIRELEPWFNTTTYRGGWKIVILFPGETLNEVSRNSLLKILEEPPRKTLFFIISSSPNLLSPTLVSRCHRIFLPIPHRKDSCEWLKNMNSLAAKNENWLSASGGAPLHAFHAAFNNENCCPTWLISLVNDLAHGHQFIFSKFQKYCERVMPIQWIEILQRTCVDLALMHLENKMRYFLILEEHLKLIAPYINLVEVINISNWLAQQKTIAKQPINPNFLFYTALQKFWVACSMSRN